MHQVRGSGLAKNSCNKYDRAKYVPDLGLGRSSVSLTDSPYGGRGKNEQEQRKEHKSLEVEGASIDEFFFSRSCVANRSRKMGSKLKGYKEFSEREDTVTCFDSDENTLGSQEFVAHGIQ